MKAARLERIEVAARKLFTERSDLVDKAADRFGLKPETVHQWLRRPAKKFLSDAGETTVHLEGFLIDHGAITPFDLSSPIDLYEALRYGLAHKRIQFKEVADRTQSATSTVFDWYWGIRRPERETQLRLEWMLHKRNVRPMYTLDQVPEEIAALIYMVGAGIWKPAELAELLSTNEQVVREDTLRRWLAGKCVPQLPVLGRIGETFSRELSEVVRLRKKIPSMEEKILSKVHEEMQTSLSVAPLPQLPDQEVMTAVEEEITSNRNPVPATPVDYMLPSVRPVVVPEFSLEQMTFETARLLDVLLRGFLTGLKPSEANAAREALRNRCLKLFFNLENLLAALRDDDVYRQWLLENRK